MLQRENHSEQPSLTEQQLLIGIGNAHSDERLYVAWRSLIVLTLQLRDADIAQLDGTMQATLEPCTDACVHSEWYPSPMP